MIDIINFNIHTNDFLAVDTLTEKAKNLFETQQGHLEYEKSFGIDLKFFLDENILFQNDAFKSYLLTRLAENSIDVASVIDVSEKFVDKIVFNLSPRLDAGFIR